MGRPLNPKITPYERADGTFSYQVRVRANGKQSTETFDSEPAAIVFKARVMDPAIGPERAVQMRDREDRASSGYVPTLAEMLELHIENLTGIQGDTKDEYRAMARRTWLPLLGSLRVDDIHDTDVARFVNALDGTVKPKTLKNAHGLLSTVLEAAVRKRHILGNPARGTRLPRTGEDESDEMRILKHSEFDRLYEAFPDHYRPLLMTLFGGGFRWSEATAMQVRDVSLDNNSLRVVRAWKRQPKPASGFVVGPPKTRRSRRTVVMPIESMQALEPLLDRPGDEWLFTTPGRGVVVRHNNFYNRIWVPACEAAGLLPRPRIHDARHSHVSWLIDQGVPIHVISARVGHKFPSTTSDIYGHLMPDMVDIAGQAASAAFERTAVRALPGGAQG